MTNLLPAGIKVNKEGYILKLDKAPDKVKRRIVKDIGLGKSLSQIVRDLRDDYEYHTTVATLSKWSKCRTDIVRQQMVGTPEFNNKLHEEYMTILFEFKKLNEKTWKLIEELEVIGEIDNRLKAFQEIREQIVLANKILGMVPESVKVLEKGQDYQGLGVRIRERLDKLAEDGVLEVTEDIVKRKMSLSDKERDKMVDDDVIDIIATKSP